MYAHIHEHVSIASSISRTVSLRCEMVAMDGGPASASRGHEFWRDAAFGEHLYSLLWKFIGESTFIGKFTHLS